MKILLFVWSKNNVVFYRVPEPKILAGSNYADLGFDLDESNCHVVSMCAIDNLMKRRGRHGGSVHELDAGLG